MLKRLIERLQQQADNIAHEMHSGANDIPHLNWPKDEQPAHAPKGKGKRPKPRD